MGERNRENRNRSTVLLHRCFFDVTEVKLASMISRLMSEGVYLED